MKFQTLTRIAILTSSGHRSIPAGQIIDLSEVEGMDLVRLGAVQAVLEDPPKYQPRVIEPVQEPEPEPEQEQEQAHDPRLEVNGATTEELEQIKGIGEATASRILANAPYSSVDEVQAGGDIPDYLWKKIKPHIRVEVSDD